MNTRVLGWRAFMLACGLAVALAYALAVPGCGGESPSLIDGEWDYALGGVACVNGKDASGTLVIFDNHGSLSGQYDICGLAYADLAGRITPAGFNLILFRGTVGIVHGETNGLALTGQVTGLGEGVTFSATRSNARKGKVQ